MDVKDERIKILGYDEDTCDEDLVEVVRIDKEEIIDTLEIKRQNSEETPNN